MIDSARWIACPASMEVPVIRREFTLDGPRSARILITGLGWFALYVNSRRVGEDVFTPALTDYEYRDRSHWAYPIFDVGHHRILYLEYDLTPYVRNGKNVLEIRLGPGFYRQKERICEGQMSFGDKLKALYCLNAETANGPVELLSDGSEQCSASEVVYSNLFMGETHDARLVGRYDWKNVEVLPAPEALLQKQTCLPDRVIEVIKPVRIGEKDGKSVYDIGRNTTFRVRLTAGGTPGAEVVLRIAEEKKSDDEIDPKSTGVECLTPDNRPQIQSDTFVLSGEKHTFLTEFVWHAGRYIEIAGEFDELLVEVVHTAAAQTSRFESSDPVLNWLYKAYLNSQLTNLHGCIPSDCPHRERLGYTGDGQACCSAAMLQLDMKESYRKWIRDILDCQDLISGHVQHTAPHMGGGGGPGGWGCAIVIVPDEFDLHYNDADLLRECYPHMQAWISYLRSHSENDLVMREEPRGWCLGDWAALSPLRIPVPFVNTCYLLDSLKRMVRIAKRLGKVYDANAYAAYAERVKKALQDTYYDAATGSFCGEVNGADAYALWVGIEKDDRTAKNMIRRYTQQFDHFDTGFLGTEILVDMLIRSGAADAAYRLLSTHKLGSYAWMMDHGATTVWETFNGDCSHNHPMFGSVTKHFFDGFLGIRQGRNSLAYEDLLIEPQLPSGLESAEGEVSLPCGKVTVSWKQTAGSASFTVTLPEGKTAAFRLGNTEMLLDQTQNRFTVVL